ncbi:MAG: c-type cytochrome [Planktomarina sp.]
MSLTSKYAFVLAFALTAPLAVQAADNGQEIYANVCAACHGTGADQGSKPEDRTAPPIFAAKDHYSDFTDRDVFIAKMADFI